MSRYFWYIVAQKWMYLFYWVLWWNVDSVLQSVQMFNNQLLKCKCNLMAIEMTIAFAMGEVYCENCRYLGSRVKLLLRNQDVSVFHNYCKLLGLQFQDWVSMNQMFLLLMEKWLFCRFWLPFLLFLYRSASKTCILSVTSGK